MRYKSIGYKFVWLATLSVVAVSGCSPTVKVEVPDKPIHIMLDVNIKQEILLRVEKDLESASVAPAVPMAKRAGWVGERPDGYLGLVRDDAPGEMKGLVDSVNTDRVARYDVIAKRNNTSRETVEAVAGRKLIAHSAEGEYIMTPGGVWTRKQ